MSIRRTRHLLLRPQQQPPSRCVLIKFLLLCARDGANVVILFVATARTRCLSILPSIHSSISLPRSLSRFVSLPRP